jgi:hypothetical protein
VERVNVDTTVQEKAIAFPTDARLYHKARRVLVRLAKKMNIKLRQNYERVSKKAFLKQGRYAAARQYNRSAIEPIFGHLKSDNRMERNHLQGKNGDRINAILSGCGFNLRKLLRAFFLLFPRWLFWSKIDHSTGSIGLNMNQPNFGIKPAHGF